MYVTHAAVSDTIPTLKIENIHSLRGFQTFIVPVRFWMLCQEITRFKRLVLWG